MQRRTRGVGLKRTVPILIRGLCTFAVLAPSVVAQEAGELEEGFFELYVERVPGRIPIRGWVDESQTVFLPVGFVLEILEIPVERAPNSIKMEWPPEEWSTELRTDLKTFKIGSGSSMAARPDEWIDQNGEPHLSSSLLGQVLGSEVLVHWEDLTVVVRNELEFPIQLRQEREYRRVREMASAPSQIEPESVPFRPNTGGAAIGWGFGFSNSDEANRGDGRLAMGLGVLGGAFEMGANGHVDGAVTTVTDAFVRFSRQFPENDWVRHMQVGHVLTEGPVARPVVGGTLTNRPRITPRVFGEALVTPAVPVGWEYEVYQGSRLLGVSEANSMAGVEAPLNYGNTPIRIRMIGPAGQEVEQDLLYVVPHGRVPAGKTYYSLGGGQCQELQCTTYSFAELAHGLANWMTLGAGADRVELSTGSTEFRPFGSLGFSPSTAVSLELEAQWEAFQRATLTVNGTTGGSLSAQYARMDADGGLAPGAGWLGQLSAGSPFLGEWAAVRVNLSGLRDGEIDAWQTAVSTRLWGQEVAVEMEEGLQDRRVTSLRIFRPLTRGGQGALSDLALLGAVGVSEDELDRFEFGASVRPFGSGLLEARLKGGRMPTSLTLSYTVRSDLGLFRARSAGGAGSSNFMGADGGLAIGGSTMVPLSYEAVGRSGIRGTVFFDDDGDGVRDPGESGAPQVPLYVGGRRVISDDSGRFHTWELTPYEIATVAVDTLGVDSGWSPAVRTINVRPTPNTFSRVDVALHRSREVTGSVTRFAPGGTSPVGGAEVEVIRETGEPVTSARTFSDGVFYIQRLRPGDYRLRLAEGSARTLGVLGRGIEVPFSLSPEESGLLTLPTLSVGRAIVAQPGNGNGNGNGSGR